MKKYLVRAIFIENWRDIGKENDLYGDSVCIDWNCSNGGCHNQWSLFEIDVDGEFKKTEPLDWVAIYLVGKNIKKFADGISFLFLEPTYFDCLDSEYDEDLFLYLNIHHYNFNDVRYSNIKTIVKKTIETLDNVVTYSKNDLATILKSYIGPDSPLRETFDSKINHLF